MIIDDDNAKRGDASEAWQVLGLVNDWLKHAEAKAGLALATAGVLAGLLYNLVQDETEPPWWVVAPALASIGSIIGAGVCGAFAVLPRRWRKRPAVSRIYYDHIARAYPQEGEDETAKIAEFKHDFALVTSSRQHLFDELATQVWANSHVATVKYKWSTLAILFVIVGAAALAVTAGAITLASR